GRVPPRPTADRFCRTPGYDPRTRHITANPGAIQSLVSNGLGVALLPRSARRYSQIAGIDPIPLEEAGARRVSALIPDGLADASEVVDLIDALRAADIAVGGTGAPTGADAAEAANGSTATGTATDRYRDS